MVPAASSFGEVPNGGRLKRRRPQSIGRAASHCQHGEAGQAECQRHQDPHQRQAGPSDMEAKMLKAGNKHASQEILGRLASDREPNVYVQARAKETLEDQKKNFKGVNPPQKKIKKQLRKPATRP